VLGLFWGLALGSGLQVAAMLILLRRMHGLPWPRAGLRSPAWTGFAQGAMALLVGQMLFALTPLVDPFFAARQGDGAVALLGMANRLILGLQGLAGIALQRAGLPLLSRWMVQAPDQARSMAWRWAALAAAGGLLLGGLVAALADPLVALLFERGQFSAFDRVQVAQLLRWGMLQMPPFLGGLVLVTALASARAWQVLAFAGGVGLLIKLSLCAALIPAFGVVGLQLATACMYGTTGFIALFALHRRLGDAQA
jgi:peptidoglycan biosynthesis protein MviN/MurJ (putative lipid II flippase)